MNLFLFFKSCFQYVSLEAVESQLCPSPGFIGSASAKSCISAKSSMMAIKQTSQVTSPSIPHLLVILSSPEKDCQTRQNMRISYAFHHGCQAKSCWNAILLRLLLRLLLQFRSAVQHLFLRSGCQALESDVDYALVDDIDWQDDLGEEVERKNLVGGRAHGHH